VQSRHTMNGAGVDLQSTPLKLRICDPYPKP